VGDFFEEIAQLFGIENGLGDGILRSGFDFVFKAFDFFFQIDRAGINADSDCKCGGTANRVVAEV
jgi:hypothetical protein